MGIGEYQDLLEIDQSHCAYSAYSVSLEVTQAPLLNGHPDMPMYRNWADDLIGTASHRFDYQGIRRRQIENSQLMGSKGFISDY